MRCRLEVNLTALSENYASARDMLDSGSQLIAVLKSDAYGLGAAALAQTLRGLGVTRFAVATYEEAMELKEAVPDADILLMGWIDPARLESAIANGIIMTVYSSKSAKEISCAGLRAGKKARGHIKLDTGLHRIGFDPWDITELRGVMTLDGLSVEGLYTHLALHSALSDARQLSAFRETVTALGQDRLFLHALDSIGMVRYPDHHLDGVRVGAWLFGVCPKGHPHPERCKPVTRLVTRVAQLRRVNRGECVGYDNQYPLLRDSVIATLIAGYGDGYPRLNNTGAVEIRGRRAPIAGLVCMDYIMADVTDIPEAKEGDEVILLGGSISIDEYAENGNFNRNEALTRISRRVPRVYVYNK